MGSPRRLFPKAALAALALVCAAGAGALWAGRGEGGEERPRSRLQFQPNAEQRRKIEALRAQVRPDNPRFSPEEAHERANAKLFTYLADTSEETHVVLAALDAIQSAYAARSSRKETPDADLESVLSKHLRSPRDDVASAAFAAARVPLLMAAPPEGLTRGIAELCNPEQGPARHYAALEALDSIRPDRRAPHVLEAFERTLGATEPRFLSRALLALAQSGPSLAALPAPDRQRVARRVLELASHADPGVRGRSLAVLSEVESLVDAPTRLGSALEALKDAHPYVRGQAADILGRAAQPSAVHALIEHVGDLAPARYDLRGFTLLDGTTGTLEHVVPGRRRVADVAQLAIVTLAATLPDVSAPVLTMRSRVESDESLARNARALRAWYDANAGRIPRR